MRIWTTAWRLWFSDWSLWSDDPEYPQLVIGGCSHLAIRGQIAAGRCEGMSVGNVATQFASELRLFMATRMVPNADDYFLEILARYRSWNPTWKTHLIDCGGPYSSPSAHLGEVAFLAVAAGKSGLDVGRNRIFANGSYMAGQLHWALMSASKRAPSSSTFFSFST